jgi:hypothetical protein
MVVGKNAWREDCGESIGSREPYFDRSAQGSKRKAQITVAFHGVKPLIFSETTIL